MKSLKIKGAMIGFAFAGLVSQAAVVMGPNTTITFEPGKAKLTDDSEAKLLSLVNEARKTGKIDDVKIAVWSDNPAPLEGAALSKSDRELADNRSKAIRNYLKEQKVSDIESYNMAERSSWLARVFHTEASEVKSEKGRRSDIPLFTEELKVFKDNGDSSKAVVVTIVKYRS